MPTGLWLWMLVIWMMLDPGSLPSRSSRTRPTFISHARALCSALVGIWFQRLLLLFRSTRHQRRCSRRCSLQLMMGRLFDLLMNKFPMWRPWQALLDPMWTWRSWLWRRQSRLSLSQGFPLGLALWQVVHWLLTADLLKNVKEVRSTTRQWRPSTSWT